MLPEGREDSDRRPGPGEDKRRRPLAAALAAAAVGVLIGSLVTYAAVGAGDGGDRHAAGGDDEAVVVGGTAPPEATEGPEESANYTLGDLLTVISVEGVGDACAVPAGGGTGECRLTTLCEADGGAPTPGFCRGAAIVQCCLGGRSQEPRAFAAAAASPCVANGLEGECKDTSLCGGTSVPGHCPGGASNQCCVTSADEWGACVASGVPGTCARVQSCRGTSTPGLCPGPASVRCCTDGGASCSFPRGTREDRFDGYSRGTYLGRVNVVEVQAGKWAERNTACAFNRMQEAYGRETGGGRLQINSAFRTMEQQRYLWNCYQTQACNSGNLAAVPGFSNHQSGVALDISTGGGAYDFLSRRAHAFGFVRTVRSERWHFVFRPGAARPTWY